MTETKVSLQIGNQPFVRQSRTTAQIQNHLQENREGGFA